MKLRLFIISFFLTPLSLCAKEIEIVDMVKGFTAEHLLGHWPSLLQESQLVFQAFAYMIFVIGWLMNKDLQKPEDMIIEIIKVATLIAIIAIFPTLTYQLEDISITASELIIEPFQKNSDDSRLKDMPFGSNYALAGSLFATGMTFADLDFQVSDPPVLSEEAEIAEEKLKRSKKNTAWYKGITNKVTSSFSNFFEDTIRWFMLILASILPMAAFMIGGVLVAVLETVRFMILHLMAVIMPVFIACLTLSSGRMQAQKFIQGYLAIIFWPVGWAFSHLVAFSMMSTLGRIIAGDGWESKTGQNILRNLGDAYVNSDPSGVMIEATSIYGMTVGLFWIYCLLSVIIAGIIITGPFVAAYALYGAFTRGDNPITSAMAGGVEAAGAIMTKGGSLMKSGKGGRVSSVIGSLAQRGGSRLSQGAKFLSHAPPAISTTGGYRGYGGGGNSGEKGKFREADHAAAFVERSRQQQEDESRRMPG